MIHKAFVAVFALGIIFSSCGRRYTCPTYTQSNHAEAELASVKKGEFPK